MTEATATAPEATDQSAEPAPAAADQRRAPMSFDDALAAMQKNRETPAKAETTREKAAPAKSKPDPTTDEDRDGDGSDEEQDADAEEVEASEDEDAEDTETEDDAEQDDDDPLVELRDGSKEPLSKLISSYQRQAALTKKEQALSEQRKATEGLVKELTGAQTEYHQKAQRYGALVESLEKIVEKDGDQWAKVDWKALKEDDPHEYLLKREEYRGWQEQKRAIEAERGRLSDEQAKEEQKAIKAAQESLRSSLAEAFPQWSDQSRLQADTQRMADTAKALGFSQDEIAMTLDPRAWKLLYEASEYRRIRAAQKSAKNGEHKPAAQEADEHKPVRVLKASGSRPSQRTAASSQARALVEKARQTRSLEDAYTAYTAGRRRAS